MVSLEQARQEIILAYKDEGYELTKQKVDQFAGAVVDSTEATQAQAQASRQLTNNMLGMGLSFLFTGMAIKRVADNMLKDLGTTYAKIMGENTRFNEQTNMLAGAFTFLKFSIFDALAQSDLFTNFVDWIVSVVNWVSEWVAKNPEIATGLLYALIAASLLGGAMMIVGQATLGLLGIFALLRFFGIQTFAELGVASKAFFASSAAASALWAAALIGAFAFVFVNWGNKLGGFRNFFAVVFLGLAEIVILTFSGMVDFVSTSFEGLINIVITSINGLISIYNSFASKLGLSTIRTLSPVELPKIGMSLAQGFLNGVQAGAFGGFLQSGLQGLQGAQQQGGNWGWLNPFGDASNLGALPPVGAAETAINGLSSGVQNVYNMNIQGLSESQQMELMRRLTDYLNEEGFLTGGSTQS